jgi:hypothetical protein
VKGGFRRSASGFRPEWSMEHTWLLMTFVTGKTSVVSGADLEWNKSREENGISVDF